MKPILLGEPPEAPTYTAAVIRATEVAPLPPEQVPRNFCLLLLKGCVTQWFDTPEEIKDAHDRLTARDKAHLMFRYEPSLTRYMAHDPHA